MEGCKVHEIDNYRADEGRQPRIVLEEVDKREDMIPGLKFDRGKHHTAASRMELTTGERETA